MSSITCSVIQDVGVAYRAAIDSNSRSALARAANPLVSYCDRSVALGVISRTCDPGAGAYLNQAGTDHNAVGGE
ncbi:MAG: hypothetical protein ABW210_05545 [Achromobacter sp.]